MIEFKKISISNFMSFRERQVIPLNSQGIVRVEGRNLDEPGSDNNQAGKSSIIEAIVWGLYGRTIREVRYDSVVNRFSRRNCCVSIFFSKGNSHYKVRRFRRHREYSNSLFMYQDGRDLSSRRDSDTQSTLESTLGVDYFAFINSVIFGGVRPFSALTDAEQKKVLESFLHFEKFDEALHRTKSEIAEAESQLEEVKDSLLEVKSHVAEVRGQMSSLRKSEAIFREQKETEVASVRREINALGNEIKELSRKRLSLKISEERFSICQARFFSLREKFDHLLGQLNKIKKDISSRGSLVGKPCPVCGREIRKDTLQSFLAHLRGERSALKSSVAELRRKVNHSERRHNEERAQLELARRRDQKLSKLKQKRKLLGDRLNNFLPSCSPKSMSSRAFSEDLDRLMPTYSRDLSKHTVLLQKRSSLSKEIQDLKFWEEGFGNRGIKSIIVRDSLPALNSKLAEFAQKVFLGAASLRFSPSKETQKGDTKDVFHVDYSAKRGSDTYLGESTGGRKRVDICVLLAFSWFSRVANVLLIDELLDGLDATGREIVYDILSKFSGRSTVLVLTHHAGLKGRIGKSWVVEKKGGSSRISLG